MSAPPESTAIGALCWCEREIRALWLSLSIGRRAEMSSCKFEEPKVNNSALRRADAPT